jgi:hypothetical protein
VCGAGRSGTTWLAELLNAANEYRYMYEPFNREQVSVCHFFGLRQYLRPDDNDPRFIAAASRIFSGRIRNGWVDQYNRALVAQRRLIKDVRSNLMLKWVHDHFPSMKIIFVLRHPCAVALSKVRLGWRIDLKKAFLDQHLLVADYLTPFIDLIAGAKSEFEQHVVAWCIENLVPLRQLSGPDVHLTLYDELVRDPEHELRSICGYLGKPFSFSMLRQFHHFSTTSKRSNRSDIVPGIEPWRKYLGKQELAYAKEVVHSFGLGHIYGDTKRWHVDTASFFSHTAQSAVKI